MIQQFSFSHLRHQIGGFNQKQRFLEILCQTLALTALISLMCLLEDNVGRVNEVDLLPFARQHIDPSWIPNDFYLNEPAGYRWPFILLFGPLTTSVGFLATSVIGRLICYTAVASGVVLLGRKIGLTLPSLLVAMSLFVYVGQGYVAEEWVFRGIEAKVVAYSFLFWAIRLMLSAHYRLMALMLGLATLFHVLVGGWATLATAGWLFYRRRNRFNKIPYLGSILAIYLVSSAWAIALVLKHLFVDVEAINTLSISTSYIFVFLRIPHHLNPFSWEWDKWTFLTCSLLLLGGSLAFLKAQKKEQDKSIYRSRLALAELTFFTLIPFGLGIAITPFDTQGKLLQYYPFRIGTLMLTLTTSLLLLCALQQLFRTWKKVSFAWLCTVLLSVFCVLQGVEFKDNLIALRNFPSEQQGVEPEWRETSAWIRNHTPKDALIISPPVDLTNFSWLTERATLAKYKLIPQNTGTGIGKWYERITDLSGNPNFWQIEIERNASKGEIETTLTQGYQELSTAQTKALLKKYNAGFFLTSSEHSLKLPVAYANSHYLLYQSPTE